MKKVSLFFLVMIFAVGILPTTAQETWKLSKDSKGVKVFTRDVTGSPYKEMRAVMNSKTPFEVAVEVMKDPEHYYEWYGMCGGLSVINKKTDSNFDMYFILDLPVVTDRDVVINVVQHVDFAKGVAKVDINRIESTYKKDSGLVHMAKMNGTFTITRQSNGEIVIVYQLFADVGGSLPAWVVNIASTDHPFKTMTGVRKQSKQDKYWASAKALHKKDFVRQ
ncbi:MAG: hypothetical protein CVV44_10065 [Spirochaetae bacterium HGW-Spirochaetae-1]|jgi:hypothetical protein|nr:MAG: hypothetical protein CVV44_10065 [Spirochaetae bacterium HGW-Spirochaetae-1]